MHHEAYEYVKAAALIIGQRRRVLEIGSCNVNGSVRPLFPGVDYVGIDSRPGRDVDIVADARTWRSSGRLFDTVVCTEVLEHAKEANEICHTAFISLIDGGVFVMTAAGEGRSPHGINGGGVGDEFYRNVTEAELREWLSIFSHCFVDRKGGDIRAMAIK